MKIQVSCLKCGCETDNPKFCSNSCAASYHNKRSPKRKKHVKLCAGCSKPMTGRNKYCTPECDPHRRDWSTVTLGKLQKEAKYQTSAVIRQLARRAWFSANTAPKCEHCGYSNHVEVCHIKAIANFPKTALIS